jgi:hypothetical protein
VGDATDRALAASLLQEFRPTVLVLNAGAKPPMGPLHEQSWEGFSAPWNSEKLLLARGAAAPNSGTIRFVQRIQLQYLLGRRCALGRSRCHD